MTSEEIREEGDAGAEKARAILDDLVQRETVALAQIMTATMSGLCALVTQMAAELAERQDKTNRLLERIEELLDRAGSV